MSDLLVTALPGVLVALIAGTIQYVRIPTLDRRLAKHLKLRTELPENSRESLDALIAKEVDRTVERDTRWLTPKMVWARVVRSASIAGGFGIMVGATIWHRLQPWEVRVTDFTPEMSIWWGIVTMVAGHALASALDGRPSNPFGKTTPLKEGKGSAEPDHPAVS